MGVLTGRSRLVYERKDMLDRREKLELELELGDLRCSGWCCCARCVC